MEIILLKCLEGCGKEFTIACPEGFDMSNHGGVYWCPVCRGHRIDTVGPFEIEQPPKLKITKRGYDQLATSVAKKPKQRENVSFQQLYSVGHGNDESGEGTLPEPEEPSVDGVVQPRARSPDGSSVYEEEIAKYFGVSPDCKDNRWE